MLELQAGSLPKIISQHNQFNNRQSNLFHIFKICCRLQTYIQPDTLTHADTPTHTLCKPHLPLKDTERKVWHIDHRYRKALGKIQEVHNLLSLSLSYLTIRNMILLLSYSHITLSKSYNGQVKYFGHAVLNVTHYNTLL